MLSIYLGEMEEAIYYPPRYFDNCYKPEWITTPFSVEMIKDIAGARVIDANTIEDRWGDTVTPLDLSGGIKAILLMAYVDDNKIMNATVCGDNCAKWILKIAQEKDLTINLRYIMNFERSKMDFEAKILNTGEMVHNMDEFISIAGQYV